MIIGLLQCGLIPEELEGVHRQYPGMFRDLLGEDSFDYREYAVVNNELPASIDEADGWLLTGSRHGAYESHDWIPPLENFLREVYQSGKPIVGICFGHQILAQALGGKVVKFDRGWSVGPVTYSLDSGETLDVIAFHQDQVISLPPGAETFGRTDFCEHAFVRYGDRALSIQPHPEFRPEYLEDLLRTRGDVLPPAIIDRARAASAANLARDRISGMIRDFFNDHAQA